MSERVTYDLDGGPFDGLTLSGDDIPTVFEITFSVPFTRPEDTKVGDMVMTGIAHHKYGNGYCHYDENKDETTIFLYYEKVTSGILSE